MKLTAGIVIHAGMDRLWELTQTPDQHARWDLRFTDIQYLPRPDETEPQRFRYATRIGAGLEVAGWGETVGEREGQASSLRFGSDDPKSLIREGSGCWIYKPVSGGVHFSTVYDYSVRYGLMGQGVDRLLFRPLMIWATRWSFDRLRLWAEHGLEPEFSLRLWLIKLSARLAIGMVWVLEGLVPKILFVSPEEVLLVRNSGVYVASPEITLSLLGMAELLMGVWLLSGRGERWAVLLASLAMLVLAGLVAVTDPMKLADPLGGVSKNLGLLACAVTVWLLAPLSPKAARAADLGRKRH